MTVLTLIQLMKLTDVIYLTSEPHFKISTLAVFVFLDFRKSGLIKRCSSSEDLSACRNLVVPR
jgi:hypothetical protein